MSEKLSTQPYKGTRDFYPQEMRLRNWFFGVMRRVLETAAFEEYTGPMLESLELPPSRPTISWIGATADWRSARK